MEATHETLAEAASFANSTWSFLPSPKDLLMALPRAASKAGSLFSDTFEVVENLFGPEIREQTMAAATGGIAGPVDGAVIAAADAQVGGTMSYLTAINLQQVRTFTGIFGYLTSRWALCCFAVAIVLNRTQVYSATRRRLQLHWSTRLSLRLLAVLPLLLSIHSVLRGLHCQTSPDFSLMRYGVEDKLTSIDFSQDGGFLHSLSSAILVGETDAQSCSAVHMIPRPEEVGRPKGSLSLLWPSFKALCLSKFVETLSCAVTGSPVATETGMSLFEHSLAFAETESMVGNLIGLSPLSASRNGTDKLLSAVLGSNATIAEANVSRGLVLSKFNTSPEVLLITLISLCNSASSQLLAMFNRQAQFRLLNTGVWGICFLASFLWAFNSFTMEQMLETGIFRFPTVCVVGFIPHLLIVFGIVLCASIYLFALLLSAVSPPADSTESLTWRNRFRAAYDNMQANAQLAHIRINMREDFYTALLRLGLSTLTAASEAVFLNEGRHINLGQMTWLEEERLADLDRARRTGLRPGPMFVADAVDQVANGVSFAETGPQSLLKSERWESGYGRERTTKLLKHNNPVKGHGEGVGTMQRSGRYVLAFDFLGKIFWLVVGWQLLALNKTLEGLHIRYRPAWLRRALEGPSKDAKDTNANRNSARKDGLLDFWMLTDDGELTTPKDDNVDVEAEMRKQVRSMRPIAAVQEQEQELDSRLYGWFTNNGWWGSRDNSGDFVPAAQEDDLTSVITNTTAESDAWSDRDEYDDGRRTPTQRDHLASREGSPAAELINTKDLVRLLDPQDYETRREARILARHLASETVVTRSQYQRMQHDPSTQVLTSSRYRPSGFKPKSPNGALSPEEEKEVLEHLIIKFRKEKGAMRRDDPDDAFSGGPQCVVCQTAPRSILAWPCRCLSLCEDCRVSLAMNNFGNCVCCRQEVVGFSRLYVP